MDTSKKVVEPPKHPPQPIKAQPKPDHTGEHHAGGCCEPKAKM